MRERVTDNFCYEEFLVSDSFPELAAKMTLDDYEKSVIKLGCESILQNIRDVHGLMKIESGKRSKELNKKVGGSDTSDHLTCNGVDVKPAKVSCKYLFDNIRHSKLPYRQIIIYDDQDIVHIAWNIPGKPYKHEALIREKGVYRRIS